jgi:hypothetical protein
MATCLRLGFKVSNTSNTSKIAGSVWYGKVHDCMNSFYHHHEGAPSTISVSLCASFTILDAVAAFMRRGHCSSVAPTAFRYARAARSAPMLSAPLRSVAILLRTARQHFTKLLGKHLAVPRAKHLDCLLPTSPLSLSCVSPHTERFGITFNRPSRHLARTIISSYGRARRHFLITRGCFGRPDP